MTIAWLSLDEDDNDPARFLAYTIAALRTMEGKRGGGLVLQLIAWMPETSTGGTPR